MSRALLLLYACDTLHMPDPRLDRGALEGVEQVTLRAALLQMEVLWVPSSHPGLGVLARVEQIPLRCALLWLVVIQPRRILGQRHEDGLDAPARLEPKRRAAVVHQVELDVAPAAQQLPLLLLLRERIVLVLPHDRAVGLHHVVDAVLGEGQDGVGILVVEVIEEDAAEAAALAAVADEEVVVRPLLELVVVLGVVLVADLLVGPVEVLHVVDVEVRRRDVGAAAKPPLARDAVPFLGLEEAVVEVHRGRERVLGVHHRRDAGGEEGHAAGHVLALERVGVANSGTVGLWRHGAVHDRHVDTRLLPHIAVGEHARDATAAVGTRPRVLAELGSINLLDRGADVVLRVADDLFKLGLDAVVRVDSRAQQRVRNRGHVVFGADAPLLGGSHGAHRHRGATDGGAGALRAAREARVGRLHHAGGHDAVALKLQLWAVVGRR
mmetsp:Transcript_19535/g.57892  ORF Transcript_19535/g.57892 Transcript_19535/m.57892 type:complete len:438 (+) Transcript_19535:431-1744(+)